MSPVPAVAVVRRPGLEHQLPEPARFWIAYAPRRWAAAEAPWTDFARGRLRGLGPAGSGRAGSVGPPRSARALPELDATELDELFYLPPAGAGLAPERDRWAASLIESGTPVVIQLEPGVESRVPGAHVVYDLAGPLLSGEIERFSLLPTASAAVWPLVAGVTDSPELQQRGCQLLARAGVRWVQPLAVELTPAQRRGLAELGGDDAFDALFHGAAPSERDFSRRAAGHGLEPFWPRPASGRSPRKHRNRRLAAGLALAGELWLRLGRSIDGGQVLLRAARGADATVRDLEAVAREGNLGVLDWLDETGAEIVRALVTEGRSTLLAALLEDYLES